MRRGTWIVLPLVTVLTGACAGGGDEEQAAKAAESTSSTVAETTSSTEAATTTTTAAPATSTTGQASPTTKATQPTTTAPPGTDTAPFATHAVGPAPTDPAELDRMADELIAAETALHDPATPEAEIPALSRKAQVIYRALAARPAAMPAVLARAPEALKGAIDANVTASVELRTLTGNPRTALPPWKIIPPPPAAELEGYYREAQSTFGVPWNYLAAVHLVETRMGRIRGVSEAGAQGPMQFMPKTWAAFGEGDINNPRDAILAAARYLEHNGAPGDMANALWNYNHSDRYVKAVTLFAQQMEANPRAYLAYHSWQVYYIMTRGDVLLEEGYGS
ncbi:MAG: transglycosylase SLT domain-containing protein [Acidimicrobiia bacterium]